MKNVMAVEMKNKRNKSKEIIKIFLLFIFCSCSEHNYEASYDTEDISTSVVKDDKNWTESFTGIKNSVDSNWDCSEIKDPAVVVYNDKFYMLYSGKGNDDIYRIGLASSDDGINWVKEYEVSPVFKPLDNETSIDGGGVRARALKYFNDSLKLWFSETYVSDDSVVTDIRLCESSDMVNWVRKAYVIEIAGNINKLNSNSGMDLYKDSSKYFLWYACDLSDDMVLYNSQSSDGTMWFTNSNVIGLDVSAENPSVINEDDVVKLWFIGVNKDDDKKNIYMNSIEDSIFPVDDSSYLLQNSETGVFTECCDASTDIGSVSAVKYNGNYYVYYTKKEINDDDEETWKIYVAKTEN